jgi:hypothetical protein
MQDQRDWRAGTDAGMESAFETALGAGENDFRHQSSLQGVARTRWAYIGGSPTSAIIAADGRFLDE